MSAQDEQAMSEFPARFFGRLALLFVLCVLSTIALPLSAWAISSVNIDQSQSYGFGYNPTAPTLAQGPTSLQIETSFSCNADGSSSGNLFANTDCNTSAGGGLVFGIFSNVICRTEGIFKTVLGLMYCSIKAAFLKPFLAILILYITLYGAMVLMGMIDQKFSEALTRVLKIALVAGLATQSDIAIQIAYKFYISLMQATISIVFNVFDNPAIMASNPNAVQMQTASYINPTGSLYTGSNWMQAMDSVMDHFVNMFVQGGVGLLFVLVALFIFMPPLFFLVFYSIYIVIKAFVQAILGYLLGLLGVTFLFTLLPIFASFALFKVTQQWVESYLKYLATFTLQIIIIFVAVMMMTMLNLVSFFATVSTMIRHYDYSFQFGRIFIPLPTGVFSLCQVERTATGEIIYYQLDASGQPNGPIGNKYDGFPRCVQGYSANPALTPGRPVDAIIGMTADQVAFIKQTVKDINDNKINIPPMPDITTGAQMVQDIVDKANEKLTIPFMKLVHSWDVVEFLVIRLIMLIFLGFLFNKFLEDAPDLATRLTSVKPGGQHGGRPFSLHDMTGNLHGGHNFGGGSKPFDAFKEAAKSDAKWWEVRKRVTSTPGRLVKGMRAGTSVWMKHARTSAFDRSHQDAVLEQMFHSTELTDKISGNDLVGYRANPFSLDSYGTHDHRYPHGRGFRPAHHRNRRGVP